MRRTRSLQLCDIEPPRVVVVGALHPGVRPEVSSSSAAMNTLLLRTLTNAQKSPSLLAFEAYREQEQNHKNVTEGDAVVEWAALELRLHPPNVEVDNDQVRIGNTSYCGLGCRFATVWGPMSPTPGQGTTAQFKNDTNGGAWISCMHAS